MMTPVSYRRCSLLTPALLLLSVCLVNPYPSGAPAFVCDSMVPSHGATPRSDPAPFHVELSQDTYRANEIITVTLKSNTTRPFIGFLAEMRTYVTNAVQPTLVGSFGDLQNVARPLCTGDGGLTHATKTPHYTLMTTWTTPSTQQGDLQVRVTFLETFNTYWIGVTSTVLRPAVETTTTPTTTTTMTTTTTTPTTTTTTTTTTTPTTTTTTTTTIPTTTSTTTTTTTTPTTTTTTPTTTTTTPTTTTTATTTSPTTTMTEASSTTVKTTKVTTTSTTTTTTTSVTTPSVTEPVTTPTSPSTTSPPTSTSSSAVVSQQNTEPAAQTSDSTVVKTMGPITPTSGQKATVKDGNIGTNLHPSTLFVSGLVYLTATLIR